MEEAANNSPSDEGLITIPINKTVSDEYRYERKFSVSDLSEKEIELIIKLHPSTFSKAYPNRSVNNIYFDTTEAKNFSDNIIGISDRTKHRIRWYGSLFGQITNPKLELKIKKGLWGKKDSYLLNSFVLESKDNLNKQIQQAINTDALPKKVKFALSSLAPTLLNTYTRKYYISADKKFRVTIDYDIRYYPLKRFNNFFSHNFEDGSRVVELKYDIENEREANIVTQNFPFRLSKKSKYVTGMERINYL